MLFNSAILLLSGASLVPASPFARQEFGDPSLAKLPSVANKLTLYRGVSNEDELSSTRSRIGQSPEYTSQSMGDFNAIATANLYFWSEEENAEIYCESKIELDPHSTCAVATYEWTPPAGVRVKRFNQGTQEWVSFVRFNWLGSFVEPLQRENDWIEGPLSVVLNGAVVPSLVGDIQHALVSTLMLPNLKITAVSDNVECSTAGAKRDTCMSNANAAGLAQTRYFQEYDSSIVSRNDPPVAQGICPGYNFGIMDLGSDSGTGKEGYAVVDDSCNQVTGAITSNVCDEALFSCSPAPITITTLHYNGQDYACRSDANAGRCSGSTVDVQYCCRNDGN